MSDSRNMNGALYMEELLNIKQNYLNVLKSVRQAAEDCGRNPDDITLIAVSKTKPIEYVKQAMEAGAVDFGENRPQELAEKYEAVYGVRWHQIGHLQKNKARHIVGKTSLIHSLDSIDLAKEINKRAENLNIIQNTLVQVNISGEESKFGINPGMLKEFLSEAGNFKNIKISGLMTISVKDYNSEQNFRLFSKLKLLADEFGLKELSMGMTHDYREAVRAGATMIRVGTAIFGERDYGNINL